jgi:hypothetical protein
MMHSNCPDVQEAERCSLRESDAKMHDQFWNDSSVTSETLAEAVMKSEKKGSSQGILLGPRLAAELRMRRNISVK